MKIQSVIWPFRRHLKVSLQLHSVSISGSSKYLSEDITSSNNFPVTVTCKFRLQKRNSPVLTIWRNNRTPLGSPRPVFECYLWLLNGNWTRWTLSSVFLAGTEWVDPEDPTVIAENELLGAAAAIEAAAKKLEQLRPRTKPKVRRRRRKRRSVFFPCHVRRSSP